MVTGNGPNSGGTGDSQLMHWSGATWSLVTGFGLADLATTPPLALWVTGHDEILIANSDGNEGGGIYDWNGSRWTTYDIEDNRVVDSFWGSGPDDIWGGQTDGQYLGHWDGHGWLHIDSAHGGVLAGGAPGDFWGAVSRSTTPVLEHHAPSGTYDVSVDLSTLGCVAHALRTQPRVPAFAVGSVSLDRCACKVRRGSRPISQVRRPHEASEGASSGTSDGMAIPLDLPRVVPRAAGACGPICKGTPTDLPDFADRSARARPWTD